MTGRARDKGALSLPPGFELRLGVADPMEAAMAAAEQGGEDGLLFWRDREDMLEAALLLRPLDPLRSALTLAYVAQVGLLDGLAALVPPETPASFDWPDRLLVNGACVGGVRVAYGPLVEKAGLADVPDWLALGLAVSLRRPELSDEPGADLEYTDLFEEGCGEITAPLLLEAFCRHMLLWLDRWQEQGFAPVRIAYEERLRDDGIRLEENGDAWLRDGAVRRRRSLPDALRQPSWRLSGLERASS